MTDQNRDFLLRVLLESMANEIAEASSIAFAGGEPLADEEILDILYSFFPKEEEQ